MRADREGEPGVVFWSRQVCFACDAQSDIVACQSEVVDLVSKLGGKLKERKGLLVLANAG